MRRFRHLTTFAVLALFSGVVSCERTAAEIQAQVDAIAVTLGLTQMTVGQTVQADAIARDASGGALTGVTITWSSSNTNVLTVTPAGLVTAVAPGTATITASAAGRSASVNVTVSAPPAAVVTSVVVTLGVTSLTIGQSTIATAVVRDGAGNTLTGRPITWSSSNTSIAQVTQAGAVATFASGSAQIIATVEGVTGSATLTVQAQVSSVTVTLGAGTLSVGQSTTATATARDAGNVVLTGRTANWSSTNSTVASVNATTGAVQALSPGSVQIVATIDGVAGAAPLIVEVAVSTVTVTLASNPVGVGRTTTATAVARDGGGNTVTGRPITWTSSNTGVATVAADGTVTGVAVGTATINAQISGVTGSASISVAVAVGSVSVALVSPIFPGQVVTATATVRDPANNVVTGRPIAWTSSNAAVATVNPTTGVVTGVGLGNTNIIAAVDGVFGTASLTVISPAGPPAQLTIGASPAAATSGVNFSPAPSVGIRDAAGILTQSNAPVTVALASGTGALVGTTTINAVNGTATFSNLRIDGPGVHTLTFTSGSLPPVTTGNITVTQVPATLSVQTQPNGALTGSPLAVQPVVRILDHAGLLIANSTLAVTAAITSGNGTLVGTATVSAVGGVATFTNLQVNGSGGHALTSTTSPALQVASANFPVAAGPPAQLGIATQPGGAASGVNFTVQPTVQIRDVANNQVTTATNAVTVALASGTGSLSGTTTVNAVAGLATFTDLRISGGGSHTLTFTATGLTSTTSGTVNVTQTPASLSIQTQPGGATTGSAMTQQPVVRIFDNAGLLIANSTLAVTASRTTGTGTLSGTTTVNAVNGVATFTNLRLDGTGNHVLTFSTVTPSLQTASAGFNVAVGPPAQLAVVTQPAGTSSGVNFATQPVVQVRDVAGSLVATATTSVTAAIASGSGAIAGTVSVAAVAGVVTFTDLRVNGVGNHSLNFTATGLTTATSNVFVVTQTPASLGIQTQPGGATTGSSMTQQPVVRILDNAGQLIANSNLAVTATRTTGAGTLSGTTTVNAVNGVATFTNLRLDGNGNHVLTFSTTSPALQVASNGFNVATGPPNHLFIATQPGTAIDGQSFGQQPVIHIRDIANQVTTSTANVTAALVSGIGVLVGTATVPAVAGVATFTNLTIQGTGNHSMSFASTGLNTQTSSVFNVAISGAPVATVDISPTTATRVAGVPLQLVITTRDAQSNVLTGRVITYNSTNPAVATVSALGVVTGLSAGSTNITATSEGQTSPVATITIIPALTGSVADVGGPAVGGGEVEILSGSISVAVAPVSGAGTYTVNAVPPGAYSIRLHPALSHSMGPLEPATQPLTIGATQSTTQTQSFVVKAALYATDFQSFTNTQTHIWAACSTATGNIPAGAMFGTYTFNGVNFSGATHDMTCPGTNGITVDPTGGPNGTSAIRYDWPNRSAVSCPTFSCNYSVEMQPRFNPMPQSDSIWFRFTDKVSANFENGGNGATGSQREYKYWLIDVGGQSCGQLGVLGMYLENAGINNQPMALRASIIDPCGSFVLQNGPAQTLRPGQVGYNPLVTYNLGNSFRGVYHTWVIHIFNLGKVNTTFRIYLDGVLISELTNPLFPGQIVGGNGKTMTVEMGANINNGPDQVQNRWFREFGVYTSRPAMRQLPP